MYSPPAPLDLTFSAFEGQSQGQPNFKALYPVVILVSRKPYMASPMTP